MAHHNAVYGNTLPGALSLAVNAPSKRYRVAIGAGLLRRPEETLFPFIAGKRCFILTDENVAAHYLPPLREALTRGGYACVAHIVAPGEGSKSFTTLETVLNLFLAERAERGDTVIALGGGVVGDLAGFTAAVLLRGVPFIQIPTTLLAQVDSSVGGKTGINCPAGKNLVGAFYQPETVIIDTDTLATLPERERKAGYAEIVKYGMIADEAFFTRLEQDGAKIIANDAEAVTAAIYRSCEIKAETVAADEKEQGARALLNFGHTFGHAYEKAFFDGGDVLHGEAVSFGMVMAADLSVRLGLCSPEVKTRLVAHLRATGLPVAPQRFGEAPAEKILEYMYSDKKVSSARLRFVLCERTGAARTVTVDDKAAVLATLTQCAKEEGAAAPAA